jgi:hypothetical protein
MDNRKKKNDEKILRAKWLEAGVSVPLFLLVCLRISQFCVDRLSDVHGKTESGPTIRVPEGSGLLPERCSADNGLSRRRESFNPATLMSMGTIQSFVIDEILSRCICLLDNKPFAVL